MIRLRCVKCQTTLELDDAFAGGTCRCSHCGTIQTVPRAGAAAASKGTSPSPQPKAIYQHRAQRRDPAAGKKPAPPPPPSGLDQLADAVTSSGLSGSGLSGVSAYLPPPTPQQKRRNQAILLMSLLGALILAGVLAAMLWRTPAATDRIDARPAATPGNGPARPAAAGPGFADLPLTGRTVVYILDKGDASREYFALLKELTLRSAATLSPEQRFLILFWDNGEPDPDLPTQPQAATPEAVASVRPAVEKVVAIGQSNLSPALTAAMKAQPDEIVLATAKGWQLDESFVDQALSLRGAAGTRIHTIALGGGQSVLSDLAHRTGGQPRELTLRQLREMLQ
jgi:hypothetical protein